MLPAHLQLDVTCPNCHEALPSGAASCPRCGLAVKAGTASMPVAAVGRASLESSVREIAQGDLLDDTYRVEQKLGQGGMGTVFLARDVKLDRDVAVKVLERGMCTDEAAVARFEREARLTARLDHPNIVPVYAVGRFHERPFMVMKLLDGTSLAQQLSQRKGPWPWPAVRAVVEPLCRGLSYLHAQGLVHRDVKPSNVSVSPTGHVTLLDFGVLKETSRDFTVTGTMLGTLRFMAPEQLSQSSQVDARADVYALGVVLYRMIAGRTPFDGDDLTVAQKKLSEDPPSASTLNPALPPGVAAVLLKAVSRDRGDRYESVDALLTALDAAYAGRVPVRPRRRPAVIAAASAALLLAAAVTAFAVRSPGATPAPAPAEPPSPPPAQHVASPPAPETTAPEGEATPPPEPPEPPRPKDHKRPAPKGNVKVAVVSMVDGKSSYAELWVDGVSRGETPAQLELAVGVHKLRLTREGFRPREATFKVTAGKPERLVIELKR